MSWLGRTAVIATAMAASACGAPSPAGVGVVRDVPYVQEATLDVYALPNVRDAPVLVLLHGCCGNRRDMRQLAQGLAGEGAVVFNASWQSLPAGGTYPKVYAQAACAVAFARSHAVAYGGDGRRITLVAWSDGALLGATVASVGDTLTEGCGNVAATAALPDAFVGVGAFLGWSAAVDERDVNDRTRAFLGPDPATWSTANPFTHLPRRPGLGIALVVGSDDPLLAANQAFASAARATGHPVTVTVVPGAGHLDMLAPSTAEGAATLRAVVQAAR